MAKRKYTLDTRSLRKLFSNKLAMLGLTMFLIIVFACLFASWISPHDPMKLNPANKLQPISWEHPLGTDQLGRDLLSRLLYGGRISIGIALTSAILTNLLGVVLGCVAGYYGGKLDWAIMYISEVFSCFPQMILCMLVISFLGQSVFWLITIFVLTGWMGSMRMVRSKLLSLKQEPYVDSCRVNGVGGGSIMFKHLLPNTVGVITVNVTMSIAGYVLSEAGLSYLGVGVSPSIPTWGNIINAAKNLTVMIYNPQLWIIPGVAISLFVLACNFFGDGLRDALDVTQ